MPGLSRLNAGRLDEPATMQDWLTLSAFGTWYSACGLAQLHPNLQPGARLPRESSYLDEAFAMLRETPMTLPDLGMTLNAVTVRQAIQLAAAVHVLTFFGAVDRLPDARHYIAAPDAHAAQIPLAPTSVLAQLSGQLLRDGAVVMHNECADPGLTYTLGASRHPGRPELYMIHGHYSYAVDVLARVCVQPLLPPGTLHLDAGMVTEIGGTPLPALTVRIVDTGLPQQLPLNALRLMSQPPTAVYQVVVPDEQGRFPDDDGYDGHPQPIGAEHYVRSARAVPDETDVPRRGMPGTIEEFATLYARAQAAERALAVALARLRGEDNTADWPSEGQLLMARQTITRWMVEGPTADDEHAEIADILRSVFDDHTDQLDPAVTLASALRALDIPAQVSRVRHDEPGELVCVTLDDLSAGHLASFLVVGPVWDDSAWPRRDFSRYPAVLAWARAEVREALAKLGTLRRGAMNDPYASALYEAASQFLRAEFLTGGRTSYGRFDARQISGPEPRADIDDAHGATDPDLVEQLRRLGETHGPLGVALAASMLTEPRALARALAMDPDAAMRHAHKTATHTDENP